MRDLLIAYGAKPAPPSARASLQALYKGTVSTADHAFIDFSSVKVEHHETFGPNGSGSMDATDNVDADGDVAFRVRSDSISASFAVVAKGYAITYAGPFTPPYKEKLDGIRFTLAKGYAATIQTVDETGKPIPGAKIEGYYPGPPLWYFPDASTDVSGAAVLEHIGAAPLNLRVRADGYQADEVTGLHLDPATPYRWTLKKAQPLPGVVTSTATGQPIPGAKIKLAGVRGPHVESYSDPDQSPLLTTADAQGRFALTSLRPDSSYFLFIDAAGHSGVLLGNIKAGQSELQITLGPELIVRGKVTHVPVGLMRRGTISLGYNQFFKIGDQMMSTGHQVTIKPINGEAEFSIGPLYVNPVGIRVGNQEINLEIKDLPKSDLLIDLTP